ncbi:MAG: hypothetical protein DWQ40_02985 [Actinobacteria bacterium]|nr:MAG: hypothetical protein DWQ40_02985 [Actinomycetota bacterium]REK39966.1 MAG: hypothetical protein DWQ20_02550 [Actinomycetota bacterium]
MTEENTGADSSDATEPTSTTSEPVAAGTEPAVGAQMFSSSEGMVALGAGLLIASYLIFGLILNDYWVGWMALLFAVFALLLPRVDRGFVEQIAPLPVLMKAVGYTIAILGVFAIVEDIRFASSALDSFSEILGALLAYGGYAIVFLGARMIKTD